MYLFSFLKSKKVIVCDNNERKALEVWKSILPRAIKWSDINWRNLHLTVSQMRGVWDQTTNGFYTCVWQRWNRGFESFSALRSLVYWNIGVLKLICERSITILDTTSAKNDWFKTRLGWDNLLHSISTTLTRMGLCFVSSGIKLNLEVFTLREFYNVVLILCIPDWIAVRECVWKPFIRFVYATWPVDRRYRVGNCCVWLTQNFWALVSFGKETSTKYHSLL